MNYKTKKLMNFFCFYIFCHIFFSFGDGGDWPVEKMVGAKEVQSWGGTALSIAFEHERSTTATLEKIRKL